MLNDRCALLFDLDGTLVNTEPFKAQSHIATVTSLGGEITDEIQVLYEKIVGISHEKTREAFLLAAGLHPTNELRSSYTTIYKQNYSTFVAKLNEPFEGVETFLQHLKKRQCKLAVVTSASREEAFTILRRTDISEYFQVVISSDEVSNPKPAPDPYLYALRQLGIVAANGVAFEDSQAGVESAVGAGLRVIGVRRQLALVSKTLVSFTEPNTLEKVEQFFC